MADRIARNCPVMPNKIWPKKKPSLEVLGFRGRVAGHDGLLVGIIAGMKLFLTGFAVA